MAARTPATSTLSLLPRRGLPRSSFAPLNTIIRAQIAPKQPFRPILPLATNRLAHSIPRPPSRVSSQGGGKPALSASEAAARAAAQPHYELTFTCVPCGNRSRHKVSKQGYHHGSVLITCPSCRNRHVISDHLGIFGDRSLTVADLMRERGRLVKKGTLGEDGDLEFWEDGSVTERATGDRLAAEQEAQNTKRTRAAGGAPDVDPDAIPGTSFGKT